MERLNYSLGSIHVWKEQRELQLKKVSLKKTKNHPRWECVTHTQSEKDWISPETSGAKIEVGSFAPPPPRFSSANFHAELFSDRSLWDCLFGCIS